MECNELILLLFLMMRWQNPSGNRTEIMRGFYVVVICFFFSKEDFKNLIYWDCVLERLHCALLISMHLGGIYKWVVWIFTSATADAFVIQPPSRLERKITEWLSDPHLCASVIGKLYFCWEKNDLCVTYTHQSKNNFKQPLHAFSHAPYRKMTLFFHISYFHVVRLFNRTCQ